jgi:hypothetical protein
MLPRRGDVVESEGEERAVRMADLVRFRHDLYGCFPRRADALFELGDALLCAAEPVASPVDLSVEPEFRRGHGSVYDALRDGRVDDARLRRLLTGSLDQARADEPLMFGIDVSPLPRPDTRYVDALSMVQVRGAGGDGFVPGWPVSFLVGFGWGASSWVHPVEGRRVPPGRSYTDVAVEQVRHLLGDLEATGRRAAGDPWPLVMFDSGYSGSELAYKLAGEQVAVLVRVRCDRVFRAEPGARRPGRGRPPRHGARLECAKPSTHPVPDETIAAWSGRYGNVVVRAWHRMHQALHRGVAWAEFPEDRDVPILAGTLIQVRVERLPHGGAVKPLWLWHTGPPGAEPDVDLVWKAYLRRFDQEHFHRFAKVYLGLDRARLQSARAADRWISLVVAGYAQLRLTAPLVADEPKAWQRKTAPGVLPTPCRARAGFRRLRAALGTPAGAAKNTRPGPGRPKGRKNRPKPRQPVYRKTDKTPTPKQQKATAPP